MMYYDLDLRSWIPAVNQINTCAAQPKQMAFSKPLGDKRPRFNANISDEDLSEKHRKLQKKNTVKGELSAQRTFTEYLKQTGVTHLNFWEYDTADLDDKLTKFWFAARQDKIDPNTGEYKKYKVQSIKSLCYGLNRLLKEKKVWCRHNNRQPV